MENKGVTKSNAEKSELRAPVVTNNILEEWLRETVAPAYDVLKANPSHAVSPKRIRARLAAEHKKAISKH